LRQTFKAMAAKAAEQTLSKEAAIIALWDIARQLGLNLTKRKMLQVVPFLGAGIGAAVNWKFMDDVAWRPGVPTRSAGYKTGVGLNPDETRANYSAAVRRRQT